MAVRRPERRWHPLRSVPAPGAGLSRHLGAFALTVIAAAFAGIILIGAGEVLALLSPDMGMVLSSFGVLFGMSFLMIWLGHLPLAVLLNVMTRCGMAGWLSVALAGLAIGAFWAEALDLWPVALIGPILALIHGAALRRPLAGRTAD
ncbi:hypothetical protein [Salipiger abyssi]|nr:hypothetical protein [Salipiger abyssi]